MRVHVCFLDPSCRRALKGIGGPSWRAYLFTKQIEVGMAFRRSDTFAGKVNAKSKWFYIERKRRGRALRG